MRGEITCFQCRSDRVLLGTGDGAVLLWSFAAGGDNGGAADGADPYEWQGSTTRKRDKFRAKLKVRGRFPKTQGFSSTGSFGGGR